MAKTTWWDVIHRTLEAAGEPLTPLQVWEKAQELGTIGDFQTPGKTPWATIGAYLYTDISANGERSSVVRVGKRPPLFTLRKLAQLQKEESNPIGVSTKVNGPSENASKSKKKQVKTPDEEDFKAEGGNVPERDLHPLLVTFAYSNAHFKAHLKTIFHESSKRGIKGQNEWLHPDLVGVYFPFRAYEPELLDLQKHLSVSAIRMFSFEMKVRLDYRNLRESFFQAVSNSSWANEGYLVAAEIQEDDEFQNELRRLSNAFGIGIIRLEVGSVHESTILFPARSNSEIDWDTVNRLATENRDFKEFLTFIKEDSEIKKVKSQYDRVLDEAGLDKWLREHSWGS